MSLAETLWMLHSAGLTKRRWLPGMLLGPFYARVSEVRSGDHTTGDLVVSIPDEGSLWFGLTHPNRGCWAWVGGRWLRRGWSRTWPEEWEPDLDDPATVGCLLEMLREATRRKWITTDTEGHPPAAWALMDPEDWDFFTDLRRDSEGRVIAAALTAFASKHHG